jgi:hypothetical protein
VAGGIELAYFCVFFGAARFIVHVSEMVFALHIIFMVFDKLVLARQLKHDSEEFKKFNDNKLVALATEDFDLGDTDVGPGC